MHVIMTGNAAQFVTPLTFETLVNNRVAIDTFDRNFEYNVEHVSLAKKADVFIVAPATANVIAKMAGWNCRRYAHDDAACGALPKLVAPAMNTGMYGQPHHAAQSGDAAPLRRDGARAGQRPARLRR